VICRVGKANGSRECAPDDRLRVLTLLAPLRVKVGTAQERLCPPYGAQFKSAFTFANTSWNIFGVSTPVFVL
jgi:hypothetical protein